jgi:hypothetical protein
MLNRGVQPEPVFIIALFLQDQENTSTPPGLEEIVFNLTSALAPLLLIILLRVYVLG